MHLDGDKLVLMGMVELTVLSRASSGISTVQ
jgi:hypothetical protein